MPLASTVSYTRLYADAGGDSHFEDVAVTATPTEIMVGFPSLGVAGPFAGGELYLVHIPTEQREDGWHNAPRRQWVVQLSGSTEIETSDGEMRCFGPGALILAEDTWGKGHNSRSLNEGGQLLLMIPILAEVL
jgi:hypothetical protein